MYNPIGAVFINGTITQEEPTNIKYTYEWNYTNKYNNNSTITTDSTIYSIVVNNTNMNDTVLRGGIFISNGTINATSFYTSTDTGNITPITADTGFTADKIISSGKHAIDV